jgi:hypothetical protein
VAQKQRRKLRRPDLRRRRACGSARDTDMPPRVEPHAQDKKKGQGRSGVSSAAVMADAAVRLVGIVPISAKAWHGGDMHAFPKP